MSPKPTCELISAAFCSVSHLEMLNDRRASQFFSPRILFNLKKKNTYEIERKSSTIPPANGNLSWPLLNFLLPLIDQFQNNVFLKTKTKPRECATSKFFLGPDTEFFFLLIAVRCFLFVIV